MPALSKNQDKLLRQVLALHASPFRESFVSDFSQNYLNKKKVPFFLDSSKNIIIGVSNQEEYQSKLNTEEPLSLLMAHMDHPGFHGKKWITDQELEVVWHGGTPSQKLKGSEVWISNGKELHTKKLIWNKTFPHKKSIYSISGGTIKVPKRLRAELANAKNLFGSWSFKEPVWEQKGNIYSRAIDDLSGVYFILEAMTQKKKTPNTLGVLSRAEEVGFVGAFAHFEEFGFKDLTHKPLLISLEASRNLPGAEIGKGPVIRVGDRKGPFDSHGTQALIHTARKTLKDFFQIQWMNGGSCEATCALSFGIPAVGITLALGNYHNQPFDMPKSYKKGTAPEFVSLKDIAGMLKLIVKLSQSNFSQDPWLPTQKSLTQNQKKYKKLLQDPVTRSQAML